MRAGPLLAFAALVAATAGCLNEFEEPRDPHYVRIVALELSPARVQSQQIVLNVTAVLDNRGGGDSDDLRVRAKAFSEATGFLLAESERDVGVLSADTTQPVSLRLEVPREGGVRIDVNLYEAGLGKERASVTARNLGALEPEVFDTGLRVRDVDFLVRDVSPGPGGSIDNRSGLRATIQAGLYVTNEGDAPSENLRILVKAREVTTRLISGEAWTDTGAIAPGATVIRSVNVTVPDGYNYVFEILTWRGDVIVGRSEGVVQLAPTFTRPKDQEVVTETPNVRDFLTPTATTPASDFRGGGEFAGGAPSPEVPGFGAAALVLAALAASGLLFLRRRAP